MRNEGENIKEKLLLKHQGYLKIPIAVRDTHGNPKKYPNPEATATVEDGELLITYKFKLDELPKKKGSGTDGENTT